MFDGNPGDIARGDYLLQEIPGGNPVGRLGSGHRLMGWIGSRLMIWQFLDFRFKNVATLRWGLSYLREGFSPGVIFRGGGMSRRLSRGFMFE